MPRCSAFCRTCAMANDTLQLSVESIEGEIALIIQYQPSKIEALGLLAGAMCRHPPRQVLGS